MLGRPEFANILAIELIARVSGAAQLAELDCTSCVDARLEAGFPLEI
jgi:hypothetical protein